MISETTVASDKVTIHASVEKVWDILIDFANYGAWNGFCPSIKNRTLAVGQAVEMMVDLGAGPSLQVEYIRSIEPQRCITWGMDNKPDDPIHAVRSQYLAPLDDGSCTYISIDEFSGPGAADMMEHFAVAVETGFNRCAYDLKAFAERD